MDKVVVDGFRQLLKDAMRECMRIKGIDSPNKFDDTALDFIQNALERHLWPQYEVSVRVYRGVFEAKIIHVDNNEVEWLWPYLDMLIYSKELAVVRTIQ